MIRYTPDELARMSPKERQAYALYSRRSGLDRICSGLEFVIKVATGLVVASVLLMWVWKWVAP